MKYISRSNDQICSLFSRPALLPLRIFSGLGSNRYWYCHHPILKGGCRRQSRIQGPRETTAPLGFFFYHHYYSFFYHFRCWSEARELAASFPTRASQGQESGERRPHPGKAPASAPCAPTISHPLVRRSPATNQPRPNLGVLLTRLPRLPTQLPYHAYLRPPYVDISSRC